MASTLIDASLRGFALPWFALSDITAKPSQAGPRPGAYVPDDSFSKGLIEVSNAQGADLEVRSVQGGGYSFAEFAVRAQAQTLAKEYAQWVAPNMLADYHFIEDSPTTVSEAVPIVLPSTQQLVVIVKRGSGILSQQWQVYPFNQATQEFDANFDLDPNAPNTVGLDADTLPDGRLYFITATTANGEEGILAYTSEDGLSWQASSAVRRFGGGFSPTDVATAQSLGNILAVFEETSGDMRQYVSTSLAGSFELVGEFAAISEGESVSCTATRDGIFLVAYLENGTFKPTVARLGSASEPIDSAQKITLDAASYADIAICDTPSGVYVYARLTGSSVIDLFYSSDEGASFTKMDRGAHSTVVSTRFMTKFKCVSYQGKIAFPFVVDNNGVNDFDDGAGMLFYGGWQNIALGHAELTSSSDILGRGSVGSGGNDVHTGLPLDVPHNVGWTQTTSGGTMVIADGKLRVTTVAQTNFETINPAGSGDATIHLWKVTVSSGGFQDNDSCAWVFSTLTSKWAVRYDTSGFKVVDVVAGSTLASVTLDMTKPRIFKVFDRVIGSSTRVITLAFRAPGSREWTIVLNEVSLDTSGVFVALEITFAHISSNTTSSIWEIWGYTRETAIEFRTSEFDTQGQFGLIGHTLRKPTPLHRDFNNNDGKATFLRMAGGSFHHNETGQIERTFDYGIENIVPQEKPSILTKWRSTAKNEQIIEFDAPDTSGLVSRLGNSWAPALYIAGANFVVAFLEYFNGVSWVLIGLWSPNIGTGFVQYDRNGSTITPAAGTASLGAYIRHNQLNKGTAIHSLSGTANRLSTHGAGVWSDVSGSLAPKVVLNIDGALGGDPASGSTLLFQDTGLMISFNTVPVYAEKWRVRIPTSLNQFIQDDFYEAAIIMPCYFVAIGQQWSNGYSVDATRSVEALRDRNNTEYREKRGDPGRVWTLPFADGYGAKILLNPNDPDFMGPNGALALTARSDVFELLMGVLRETGGATPIVAVRNAQPDGIALSETIVGIDNTLYGYLDGPVGFDNVAGDDGETTEFNRGVSMRVVEIV